MVDGPQLPLGMLPLIHSRNVQECFRAGIWPRAMRPGPRDLFPLLTLPLPTAVTEVPLLVGELMQGLDTGSVLYTMEASFFRTLKL